jgi:phosphoglycolate phosphatase
MKKIKAKLIGWDLDGTLADNFDAHYQAMCAVFKKFNMSYPTKEEYGEKVTFDLVKFYNERGLSLTRDQLSQFFREIIENFPPPKMFDSAKITLEKIRSKNIEQALITMASEYRVTPFIKNFDIEKIFFAVHSNINNKQEVIAKIIQEKNIDPKHFVYVGDTPSDVEAANNAGAISVGFAGGFASKKALEKSHPNFLINDHKELLAILNL